jgi:hypothetical protein
MVTTIGPWKRPAGTAGKVGDEHRHQGASFHVSHPDPRVDQGVLEGQAATEQESDEIVAPEVADFSPLLDQLAPAVDAVARQVGAEVSARAERAGSGSPGGVISMSGQGLGLRVQKAANSTAASFGRMTRFAC